MKKYEFCNIFITTEENMTVDWILAKLDFSVVTSMTLKLAAANFSVELIGTNKNVILTDDINLYVKWCT
jgi:hypothetical protein